MGRTWLLLTLSVSIAACGGNAQLRTEVDMLRAEIAVLEARQAETGQGQQPSKARKPVRPTPVEVDGDLALALVEQGVAARVEAIADEVCACKDIECAVQAMKAMDTLKEGDRPSEQDMEKIGQSMGEMTSCITVLAKNASTP